MNGPDEPRPVLTVESVSKAYGPVQALKAVSTEFFPGEIHAVLGENGAGKSTLMGVLAGFVVPDQGRVDLQGRPAPVGQQFRMKELGVRMVHQHFMLVPNFTVQENLALANLGPLTGPLDLPKQADEALQEAQTLHWPLEPEARAGDLPVGLQQRLEILKALAGESQILILDEPTGVLSPEEVDGLFTVLRELKSQGKTIVLIAHKLDEVMAVADRVTVLRKGRLVARSPLAQTNPRQLAEWMVGDLPDPTAKSAPEPGPVLLNAQEIVVLGDRGETAVDQLSLQLHAGEILGLGGVDGNGQVELAEALARVRSLRSGTLTTEGDPGYIPQDRHQDGLALGLSIQDNMLLSGRHDAALYWGPFLKPRALKAWANSLVEAYEIKVGDVKDPARSLSGGNQQKVVVSRVLSQKPQVIIAVNPTRGLDLKATDYVHQALRAAAKNGAAVLLVSTDLDELQKVADRTTYISRGRLTDRLIGIAG